MRIRQASLIALVLAGAVGVVWAQTQTATANAQQGQGGNSASASSRASGSGNGSGGGAVFTTARPTHAILYAPGEKWIPDRHPREQPLHDHVQYMASLTKRGILILGGPWRDEGGGMAIIRVKNDEEARAVLESDPAITQGVMVGELKPWNVMFQGPGIPTTNLPAPAARPPR